MSIGRHTTIIQCTCGTRLAIRKHELDQWDMVDCYQVEEHYCQDRPQPKVEQELERVKAELKEYQDAVKAMKFLKKEGLIS